MKDNFNFLAKYRAKWGAVKEVASLMFNNSYDVLPATTPDLVEEAYHLRLRVFCSEINMQKESAPSLEFDKDDYRSSQLIVYSRDTDKYIGCARLIHGRFGGEQELLPIEYRCQGKIDLNAIQKIKDSGHNYAEISSLAIDKDFRNSKIAAEKSGIKSKSSDVLFSLYLGILAMANEQDVRYGFAVLEERLMKNLQKHSVPITKIGETISYFESLVPIVIDMKECERVVPKIFRPLYTTIGRKMADGLSNNDKYYKAMINKSNLIGVTNIQ